MPLTGIKMSGGKVLLDRMMSNPGWNTEFGMLAQYVGQISGPQSQNGGRQERGEKVMPRITAIRSAPLDNLRVTEIS